MLKQQTTIIKIRRKARVGLLCCLFAILALAQAATAEDFNSVGSVQGIALSGVNTVDLEFEITDGVVSVVPDIMVSSVAEQEKELVAVPLPAAIWLFGSGLFGFIMLSNKRSV